LTKPLELKGKIDIINKTDGDRIIAGYANVAVVDKQEQFIPIETLQKGIETLLQDPHYANLMLVHKNIQIGKIIESYENFNTRVDDKGLFIVCEVRKDTEISNEVWDSILNGEYGGFSIGCEVLVSHKECAGTDCVTILDEINIFEVSVCSSPVNQESGFVVVSKSEYEASLDNNVCVECDKQLDIGKMTKKATKSKEKSEEIVEDKTEETVEVTKDEPEEPVEEKTEEVEKTLEEQILERLEKMEQKVNAFEGLLQESVEEECAECKDEEKTEDDNEQKTEEKPDDENTEDKAAPWGSMDPNNQQSVAKPPLIDPTNYPNLGKAIEDLTKAVADLNTKLSESEKVTEEEELKMSVKARDDQIEALKKKVEVLEKSEEQPEIKEEQEEKIEPQTVQDEVEEKKLMDYNPIKIRHGEVYFEE